MANSDNLRPLGEDNEEDKLRRSGGEGYAGDDDFDADDLDDDFGDDLDDLAGDFDDDFDDADDDLEGDEEDDEDEDGSESRLGAVIGVVGHWWLTLRAGLSRRLFRRPAFAYPGEEYDDEDDYEPPVSRRAEPTLAARRVSFAARVSAGSPTGMPARVPCSALSARSAAFFCRVSAWSVVDRALTSFSSEAEHAVVSEPTSTTRTSKSAGHRRWLGNAEV